MNSEIHPDYRSGAKLGGELVDEYDSVEFVKGSGSRFTLEVTSGGVFVPGPLFDKAERHGFRVAYVSQVGDVKIGFTRIDDHPTNF